jgi:hypothetical protein
MRTLKQIVTRINQLATSHQLINQVGFGTSEDLGNLVKEGLTFPMCFIEIQSDIATSRNDKLQRFNFKIFLYDLPNRLTVSRSNILEIESDLVSIATDLLAMLQRDIDVTENQDWVVSPSTTLSIGDYKLSDLCIGVELPIQVGLRYAADRCQVPSDEVPEILNDMKIISVYKHSVVSDTETLTLPFLKKEILLFYLGNNPLKQVQSNPSVVDNVVEFTYNYSTGVFVFGTTIFAGTFIQILNRPI